MWPVFEISVLDPTKHQNKTVQSGCCGPVCNPIGQFDHKVTSFVNKNNRSSVWVNWVNEIRGPTSKLTSLKHVTFFLPIWNRNGGEHTILCKCSSITISIETVQTLASALPTPDFCQGCLGRPTKKNGWRLFWWFRKYSFEDSNYRCSNETCETCKICMVLMNISCIIYKLNMSTGSNVVFSWFETNAAKLLLHILCLFPQTIHHKVFCIILRCIQGVLATDFAWLDHRGQ